MNDLEDKVQAAIDGLDLESKVRLFNQLNSWSGYGECYIVSNEGSELSELFPDVEEALRAAFFGDYDFNAPYITLDVYRNIKSIRYSDDIYIDARDLMELWGDEVFQEWVDLSDDLKALLITDDDQEDAETA